MGRAYGVWVVVACGTVAVGGCYTGVHDSSDSGADGATDTDTQGTADDADTGSDDGNPSGCDDDELSVSPLRRLSEAQYRNTLRDLFGPTGIDVETEIASDLDRIPPDDAESTFGILDTRMSDLHARAYYRIADALSYVVIGDDGYQASVAGDCALTGMPDTACIDAFADGFARRAYRRPLDDIERQRLHTIAGGAEDGAEAVRSMVFAVLMAPQFVYHVEVQGDGDDQRFDVGPYELAARLSFHFWQTMPDDELFAAAADGSIATTEGYTAQLDRVFEDPRTQDTVDRFYNEWLKLGWFTEFPVTPAFATLAEGTSIGEPDADHLAAAQDEIHALTRYYTWQTEGTMTDVLLSDRSFTPSSHLAALYGVEPWDGQSDPPAMPAAQRAGLLTRVAFLLTGDHETHPIHRGAAVRRRILCEELPSPNPTSLPEGALDPPPVDETQTTRQRYEAKTADATCQGCHSLINPVGFVLEEYDALGRHRDQELVIDEETGEVLASLPIDSTASLDLGDGEAQIGSGLQLSELVAASGAVEACFARQYFRATFGREDTQEDQCGLEYVSNIMLDGSSMKDALRAVAETPVFKSRRVQ